MKGHKSMRCCYKKKKVRSDNKAGAVAETRLNKTRSKRSHCGRAGHVKRSCRKKYPCKAPSKSSTEVSGAFLEEELLVCNININDISYVA
jgi:hypothetical protein